MKTTIKSLLMLVLMCCVSQLTMAQKQLVVKSFEPLPQDMTARIDAPVNDQNGERCALIKVSSNVRGGLKYESPALGITKVVQRTGETWVYIPAGSKNISIFHNDYGAFRGYMFPVKIESNAVYAMEIVGEKDPDPTLNAQLITINVSPATASLYVDDEEVPVTDGVFSSIYQKGIHTFRVEADRYDSQSGKIELGDNPEQRSINLSAKFGYLSITSYPEKDANVYVNDALVGKTPFTSQALDPKEYKIRIEKEFFFPIDTTAIVEAKGRTTFLDVNMISTIVPEEGRKTFVLLEGAMGGSQTSFGAMIGMCKKNGAYLRFRSDFGSASADLECDDSEALTDGSGTPFYKEGVSHKSRMSITAGYMRRINKPLYLYAGAGYGSRVLAWETTDDVLVKNVDHSATGVAAEVGAIARFGSFALTAGYQTVNFKYHEFSAGIGFVF